MIESHKVKMIVRLNWSKTKALTMKKPHWMISMMFIMCAPLTCDKSRAL